MRNYFAAAASITACLALGTLGAAGAHAQVTFTLVGPGTSSQEITVENNGGSAIQTESGPYAATLNGVAGQAFCCDFTHDIDFGDTYQADSNFAVTAGAGGTYTLGGGTYYQGGLASALISSDYNPMPQPTPTAAQQRADEVAWLAATYTGATATAFNNDYSGSTSFSDNEAGVTMAIWDILQDGTPGGITGADGGTYGTGLDSLASFYENQASTHSTYTSSTVLWVQAPIVSGTHPQEFMFISNGNIVPNLVGAVPEPGVVVTMLSLTGLLGLGMVRGRRRLALNTNFKA